MTKPIPYPLRGEWLITQEGADQIMSIWQTARDTGKAERIAAALEARDGQPFKNERRCAVNDGVAVMDIDGPLMRKAELFSDISGATSYQWIGATCDALRADPSVQRAIIRFNTPGGEAAGVGECGEKIAALAAEKHVEAYVETQCASAGMWLAAQCSHITAHRTAQVGWVGAIGELTDTSARDERDGVRRIQVVSKGAEKKRTQPMSAAVVDRAKTRIDKWGGLFTAAMAKGRGVSEETVLRDFGAGDGMFSDAAAEVGLVDAIGNFESVIGRLSDFSISDVALKAWREGEDNMSAPENKTALAAGQEWQCKGCSESMGPSAAAYCAKCAMPDDDDDEDEDEAKALGLDVKATAAVRRERMVALTSFYSQVVAHVKADSASAALVLVADGAAALAALPAAQAELAKAARENIRRDFRAALEQGLTAQGGEAPRLSLGAIQTTIPLFVADEKKREEMLAAVAKLDKVTKDSVLDAVCGVDIGAGDLRTVQSYAKRAAPVAAATHTEPERDGVKEAAELNETEQQVKAAADAARKTLDRGIATPNAK